MLTEDYVVAMLKNLLGLGIDSEQQNLLAWMHE